MIDINISKINNTKIILLIVTYNSERFIRKLCSSILTQDYDLSQVLLVVIDNNSNDNTYNEVVKCVRSNKSKLNYVILKLSKNLGFTPANNIGLILAIRILGDLNDKIILLLNPDTHILSKDFFRNVERLSRDLPIVGFSTISGENYDVIDSIGAFIDYLGNPQDLFCCVKLTDHIKKFLNKTLPKAYYMPLACFAAVAIRGDVIQKIGFLRNDYVIYFDDTEYCLRSWSRGIPVIIYRDFMIWHARGGTQKPRKYASRDKHEDDGIFLDIPYHFSKNNLLLVHEYLGSFKYILRVLLYSIIGPITSHKHLAFSIVDSLRIIVKRRIKTKRLPKGLVPRNSRTLVLLWALKYFINYPSRGTKEAVAYGVKRASIEYIKHRFYKRPLSKQ